MDNDICFGKGKHPYYHSNILVQQNSVNLTYAGP